MGKYKKLIFIIICVIIIALCSSCKSTEYVEVPVETVKTEYVHQVDSFFERDSVWTYIEKKQDTVYVDRYKEKLRTIVKKDTVCRTDTIPKIIKIKEVVEVNKLKKWLKILMFLGGGVILGLFGSIIYKLKKWKLLF